MAKDEMVEQIKRTAVPTHLIDASTDDLKEEVEAQLVTKEEKSVDIDDPKLQEEYSFDFSWKDGRGKQWEGHFVNKILSIKELQAVGVLRAKLSGGISFESLDHYTSEINLMTSHMTFSLTTKPKWAEDLRNLKDVSLLQALYGEVASHEAMFFGYSNTEGNS